jgi:hypothetical protein
LTGFLRISFFPAYSGGIFHRNLFLEGSQEFRFFLDFTGIFCRNSCGQEFLYLIRIPPESGRIPVPAYCCLARPATKEGSLLRKIWTKIDLFQPLSRTGLDHGFRCPLPLLAPPSLKVRAAAAVEAVMAEEAALMVEALADVSETTIATADADNIRPETTINNRPGAQLCLAVATTEVGGLADEYPANFSVFFYSGGILKIRRAKKIRKNKRATD